MIPIEKSFASRASPLQAVSSLLDFQQLPAFLRVLLTTDGTVTSALEAYFLEPIVVDTLRQFDMALTSAAPAIECRAGDHVLRRDVQLRGAESQRIYARAESMIRSELLSAKFRAGLVSGAIGVGELLRECGLETYREVLLMGYTGTDGPMSSRGGTKDTEHRHKEVQRTYRIIMNHQPFIEITEYFPIALF